MCRFSRALNGPKARRRNTRARRNCSSSRDSMYPASCSQSGCRASRAYRFRRARPSNQPAPRSAGTPGEIRRETSRARASFSISPRSSRMAQA